MRGELSAGEDETVTRVHEGEVDKTILCQRLDIEETSIEAKLVVLELLREGEDMLVGGMCYEGELRELART